MTDPAQKDEIVAKLTRAGVITHVARVSEEAGVIEQDAVSALLSLVGHSIFRIAPFVYGVDLARQAGDGAALAGELRTILGDGMIQIDRIETPAMEDGAGFAPIQLLRALSESTQAGCAEAPAGTLAVIDAGYALRVAELSAARIAEALADPCADDAAAARLAALDGSLAALADRLATLEARLGGQEANPAALTSRLDALEERLLARAEADAAETRATGETLQAALEPRLRDIAEALAPRAEPAAGELEALSRQLSGIAAAIGAPLDGPETALPERLAALSERIAALERRLDTPPADRSEEILAAIEALGTRLAETEAKAETPPAAAISDLAARLDGIAAASRDGLATLQAAVDGIGERIAAVESRLPSPDGAGSGEAARRLDALAAAMTELGAELRDRAETLAGAVESLTLRLEAQERARDAADDAARERDRALRSGLAELAARIDLARDAHPAA